MPVANPDPTIISETHVFKDNEAPLNVPIYNKTTGLYGGPKKNQLTLHFEEMPMRDFTHVATQKRKAPFCIVP